MKKDFVAHCTIKQGMLIWKNREYMAHNLPNYEGLVGVLTIVVKKSTRSLNQNALYWEWVTICAEYCGNTKQEMHEIFKDLFGIRIEARDLQGNPKRVIKSTSTYTKGEMVGYMFDIEQEAAKLGILLPHPEDLQMPILRNEDEKTNEAGEESL